MRQYFLDEQRWGQTWRFQCLKSPPQRYAPYPDRYSILRKPWSLVGQAIRPKERHLVPRLRPLRNDRPQSSIQIKQHEGAVQKGYCCEIPSNQEQWGFPSRHLDANQDHLEPTTKTSPILQYSSQLRAHLIIHQSAWACQLIVQFRRPAYLFISEPNWVNPVLKRWQQTKFA